jgi:hypothetical protein
MPENLTHTETKPKIKVLQEADWKKLERMHRFYIVKTEKSEGQRKFKNIKIERAGIIEILQENNYYRYDLKDEEVIFVQVNQNVLKVISTEKIKDFFRSYCKNLPTITHEDIMNENPDDEYTCRITGNYIYKQLVESDKLLSTTAVLRALQPKDDFKMQVDNRYEKYLFYANGFLCINKDGYELKDYSELENYIWESQQQKRNFIENKHLGDFEKFVFRLCGHREKNFTNISANVYNRFNALRSTLGYLMHSFFDRSLVAPIFTDMTISDFNEANGRTGKSMIIKGIQMILNANSDSTICVIINGRDFDPDNKHKYGAANFDTQLVVIDDIKNKAKFDTFFNDITEGAVVDKKNAKPFMIKSKIAISTNMTIKIEGESAKARAKFFEVSDYFKSTLTPRDEFGKWFFSSDWDETDWNQFDTFMVGCIQYFLKNDLLEAAPINLAKRSIMEHTAIEFMDFMESFFHDGKVTYQDVVLDQNGKRIPTQETIELAWGEKMNKQLLYKAFISTYPDFDSKTFTRKRFSVWLKYYSDKSAIIKPICKQHGTESRSNSTDFITFIKKEQL